MTDINPDQFDAASDVFTSGKYTLPQIRDFAQEMNGRVEEKMLRIRNKVGSSYRDLLDTADSIVQMKADNDEVQSVFTHMGHRCSSHVVDAKTKSLARFLVKTGSLSGSGSGSDSTAAHARCHMLSLQMLAVSGVLRGSAQVFGAGNEVPGFGSRLVLATKVYILARLFLASLIGTGGDDDATIVSTVRNAQKRLPLLHRLLLHNSEKILRNPDVNLAQEEVLQSLAAYSLATNSGIHDVLRHFLHIRTTHIQHILEEATSPPPSSATQKGARSLLDVRASSRKAYDALQLYTRTVLDFQYLNPRRLSVTLRNLTKHCLIKDESLRGVQLLRFDLLDRCSTDEIQYFTPYISHLEFTVDQGRDMLRAWVQHCDSVVMKGLQDVLSSMHEFRTVANLRRTCLQLWIRQQSRGRDPEATDGILTKLRDAFLQHLVRILQAKTQKLHLLSTKVIPSTISSWPPPPPAPTGPSLWDRQTYDFQFRAGGLAFLQQVQARAYGRDESVRKTVASYQAWHSIVEDATNTIEELRQQRWDDISEEVEDEDTVEEREKLLRQQDPQLLTEDLTRGIVAAFGRLQADLERLWHAETQDKNDAAKASIATYLVRVLRDIRGLPPKVYQDQIHGFGLPLLPGLYRQIARMAALEAMQRYSEAFDISPSADEMVLWQSVPSSETDLVPSYPSPLLASFLRDLSHTMNTMGTDIWTVSALHELRNHIAQEVSALWRQKWDAYTSNQAHANDPKPDNHVTESSDAAGQQHARQFLFDHQVLLRALAADRQSLQREPSGAPSTVVASLTPIHQQLLATAAFSDVPGSEQFLAEKADEFWAKSRVLFGMML